MFAVHPSFHSYRSLVVTTSILLFAPIARAIELPSGVQSSLTQLSQNPPPESLEIITLLGESLYCVDITQSGVTREWVFDKSGVPLSIQSLQDDLPAAVASTVAKELSSGMRFDGISRSFESEQVIYELELSSQANSTTVWISVSGEILAREVPLQLLPAVIQKRLNRLPKERLPEKCMRSEEDGKTYFSIGLSGGDNALWLTYSDDGNLTEEETCVTWPSVPVPVQTAILSRVNSQEKLRVLRKKSEGEVSFEVWSFARSRLEIFSINPDGTITDYKLPPL